MGEAHWIRKESCPHCGSSDANVLYSDGSHFCFSCGTYTPPNGGPIEIVKNKEDRPFYHVTPVNLKTRGISADICRKYGYGVSKAKHEIIQVANYYWQGELVAQHIRTRDKHFFWRGNTEQMELFGAHTRHENAHTLIITEGEIDALSVAQSVNNKFYTVVSVPSGAQSAAKYLKMNYELLDTFNKVILWFDNDDAGLKALKDCAEIIPGGKLYFVHSETYKDANEVLQKKGAGAIQELISTAQLYKPEALVEARDISLDALLKTPGDLVYKTNFKGLNKFIHGLKKQELTIIGAGTGVGKSTFLRHLTYHLLENYPELKIAYLALEETNLETLIAFIAIDNKVKYGDLWEDRSIISKEAFEKSYNKFKDRLLLFDKFGWVSPDEVLKKMEYAVRAWGADFIFLDHLTMLTYSLDLHHNERRSIDHLIAKLRTMINTLPAGIVTVSHLNMKSQKAHEEGGRVTLEHLRGSGSIKQLADLVLALERNTQSPDPDKKHQLKLRVLKSRVTGETGVCSILKYTSGVLIETQTFAPYEFEEYEEPKHGFTEQSDF